MKEIEINNKLYKRLSTEDQSNIDSILDFIEVTVENPYIEDEYMESTGVDMFDEIRHDCIRQYKEDLLSYMSGELDDMMLWMIDSYDDDEDCENDIDCNDCSLHNELKPNQPNCPKNLFYATEHAVHDVLTSVEKEYNTKCLQDITLSGTIGMLIQSIKKRDSDWQNNEELADMFRRQTFGIMETLDYPALPEGTKISYEKVCDGIMDACEKLKVYELENSEKNCKYYNCETKKEPNEYN